ncbi:hypothetical protein MCOR27_000185 [Pyricularia oryzae]|uniref:Uncharacterized protein n=1 Tax=Pyricularia grisea TaxID=148305 RepID=A0ABQ8P138_PYRGI|nr:hypothetical protein MCOR02_008687 [Pyricularia oryzae]KAI6304998.1 hypothetical protein MCOR33_000117 [Pyricularia grisea]KAI6261301.1 hypothetical protein MCOR19_002469 [Pyricularia oryzae]KAI6287966.1 hypothetical protein MCOR26_011814 [Pyricularia oryzae]KAI6289438.1 hypothetical protein MCOR27_000185 [Pyricularia oryzae]
MPMPRANVQSLGAHVSNMAGSARSYVFGNNSRNSKQNSIKTEAMMDDDESSSGSDSDSDMSDGEGTENFLSKINAATAAKKTNAAAKGGAKLSDSASTPATATKKASMFKAEPNVTEKKIKPEPATSSSESSSESDSEDEKTAKKSAAATKKAISKPEPKKAPVSSDSDSSSESDSDEDQSGAKIAAPQNNKQSNTTANNESESSSSEESEDESEEEAQVSKPSKTAAKDKTKKATKAAAIVKNKAAAESSSSDSESESDSDSDSSEETSSSEDEKAKPAKAIATKKAVNGVAKSKSKKPADDSDVEMADESFALVSKSQPADGELADEFVREGFQLRKASEDTDVSEVLNIFKQAKREGKQIWYFTTPASVPVSVVEKMNFPMRNAQTGDPIVSHNGVDYGVDLGATGVPSTYKILVPAKKGSKYEMVDRGIDHTMHLKRITQLAASDFTAKPKAEINAKPPRPQPPVLKKRYTPIGVPTPILPPLPSVLKSRGDVAMTDAPEENGSTSEKKSKKRKANAEEAAKTPSSETKSKKAKTINSISADPSIPKSTPSSSTPMGTGKKPQAKGKTTATATPVSQAKARSKSSAEPPRTQTPVPLPKMPGLKR